MFENYTNPSKLARARQVVKEAGGDPDDEKIVYEVYKRMGGWVRGDDSTKLGDPAITPPPDIKEIKRKVREGKMPVLPQTAPVETLEEFTRRIIAEGKKKTAEPQDEEEEPKRVEEKPKKKARK